jgi:hypothetical protein
MNLESFFPQPAPMDDVEMIGRLVYVAPCSPPPPALQPTIIFLLPLFAHKYMYPAPFYTIHISYIRQRSLLVGIPRPYYPIHISYHINVLHLSFLLPAPYLHQHHDHQPRQKPPFFSSHETFPWSMQSSLKTRFLINCMTHSNHFLPFHFHGQVCGT